MRERERESERECEREGEGEGVEREGDERRPSSARCLDNLQSKENI